MSTLKTTLKLESTSLFPAPISYTTVVNSTSGGDSNFGKLNLVQGTTLPITTNELYGKGNFLYVSSPTTNPSYSSIEILGESGDVISTLFSGDAGFIPVTVDQGKLYARTTWGNATLDYFVGSRGAAAGKSAMIYSYDDGDNWKFFLIDSASCTPTVEVDTGYARNDWNFNIESIVQDKGYVVRLWNIGGNYDVFLFIGPSGKIVNTQNFENGYNTYWECDGKCFITSWNSGDYTWLRVFDGEEVYDHSFYSPSNVYPEWNWAATAANGTIPIYVEDRDGIGGQEAIYFIKGNRKTLVTDLNYNDNGYYNDSYVTYYHNFCVIATYDDWNGVFVRFAIYDLSGNLLRKLDLTVDDDIVDWDYNFSGSTGFQAVLYNNGDYGVDYLMFNYNQKTGKMIGEDKSWHHTRDGYDNFEIFTDTYDIYDQEDYLKDGVAIAFYYSPSSDYSRLASHEVNTLDIHYIIDNGDLRKHTVTNGSTLFVNLRPYWYSEGTDVSSTDAQFLWSVGTTSGPLNSLVLTKTGTPTSFVAIPELSIVYYDEGFDWLNTGDYRVLGYWGSGAYDFTTYSVINSTGILDNVTVENDYEYNIRYRKNSIFFRTWGTETLQNYYFNVSTKKWVELSTFYSQRGWVSNGTTTSGLSNGTMVIFKPDYYTPEGSFKVRVLNNGVITNEVDITPDSYDNWDWYVTDDHFFFLYQDPEKYYNWQIDVYNFSLTKLYSINTGCTSFDNNDEVGPRGLFRFNKPNSVHSYYMLGELINTRDVNYDGDSSDYEINDQDWWD